MLPLPHLKQLPKHEPRSFTSGVLPTYIDAKQPPLKRQPFAAVRAQRWVSDLELALPEELAAHVTDPLKTLSFRYAKVIMKVGDILEGEFFTNAVKKGEHS